MTRGVLYVTVGDKYKEEATTPSIYLDKYK